MCDTKVPTMKRWLTMKREKKADDKFLLHALLAILVFEDCFKYNLHKGLLQGEKFFLLFFIWWSRSVYCSFLYKTIFCTLEQIITFWPKIPLNLRFDKCDFLKNQSLKCEFCEKCEFSGKCNFENENFVEIEIMKRWILWILWRMWIFGWNVYFCPSDFC